MVHWLGFEPRIEVYKTPVITTLTTCGYWYGQRAMIPRFMRERQVTLTNLSTRPFLIHYIYYKILYNFHLLKDSIFS